MFKVSVDVKVVRFCRLHQAIDDGTGFCTGYRVDHHPVLAANRKVADAAFRTVVVDWDLAIF